MMVHGENKKKKEEKKNKNKRRTKKKSREGRKEGVGEEGMNNDERKGLQGLCGALHSLYTTAVS